VSDLTALRVAVFDPLETLKVDLPDEVVRLLALWDAAGQIADADPADDLRAAVADGTVTVDTIADRLRQGALDINAKQGAVQLRRQLEPHLAAAISAALHADGDRIVTDLRPTFDRAAETVTAMAGKFSGTATPATILAAGPEASAAFHQLTEHQATLDRVWQARLGLASTCGYGTHDVPVAMCIETADDLAHLHTAGDAYRETQRPGGRWAALATAGYRLHLNTTEQARQLVDQATEATRSQERARHATPPRPPILVIQ
jgi:hypothetical protein